MLDKYSAYNKNAIILSYAIPFSYPNYQTRFAAAEKVIFILFEIVTFCILQVLSCDSNSIRGRVLPVGVRSFAMENPDFE